jgi:hypothetical protein
VGVLPLFSGKRPEYSKNCGLQKRHKKTQKNHNNYKKVVKKL